MLEGEIFGCEDIREVLPFNMTFGISLDLAIGNSACGGGLELHSP